MGFLLPQEGLKRVIFWNGGTLKNKFKLKRKKTIVT